MGKQPFSTFTHFHYKTIIFDSPHVTFEIRASQQDHKFKIQVFLIINLTLLNKLDKKNLEVGQNSKIDVMVHLIKIMFLHSIKIIHKNYRGKYWVENGSNFVERITKNICFVMTCFLCPIERFKEYFFRDYNYFLQETILARVMDRIILLQSIEDNVLFLEFNIIVSITRARIVSYKK